MILVDFSQIVNASFYVAKKEYGEDINEDIVTHLTLNSLRYFNKKFRKSYGELVVCCDHHSWRKDKFEHYKAHRKSFVDEAMKEERTFINKCINDSSTAISEHLPFRTIKTYGAEGDDIIGTLSMVCHKKNLPCLIISTDKDFFQLAKYGAKQFSPIKNSMFENTKIELRKHYITHLFKGDGGDGIPNIFSDDDQLVNSEKRQPPVPAILLEEGVNNFHRIPEFLSEFSESSNPKIKKLGDKFEKDFIQRNFKRNLSLIDLRGTPKELKKKIVEEYKTAKVAKEYEMTDYISSNGLGKLLENISDFYIEA